MSEKLITHKKVDEMLIAGIWFKGEFKDIILKVDILSEECNDYINGPAMAVYDYGVYTDGIAIEACFPVTEPVETDVIKSRILERAEVLSITHFGPRDTINESYRNLYGHLSNHAIVGTSCAREIFLEYNPENPEENVTEIQAILHKWNDRLAQSVERVLGASAREEVIKSSDVLFTLESSGNERAQWVRAVVEKLDELASTHQKYDILSKCAHDFSKKRISRMRAIYERNKDIDEVLEEMAKDPAWYEKPTRKGNIIFVTKGPCDRNGYEKAETELEKKKSYCHCPLVREYLNEEISPTFCYCGAGWYRQQWEGILGKPVTIEILKSLPKGDSECQFAIHLPVEVS
ncbi:MAG: GyrI-like domain-containing protein [Theionarchaea archaeon]|nr:GyrI-like domain-containing protein [Theionarchaea archaeon]